jgi:hypothetical protein
MRYATKLYRALQKRRGGILGFAALLLLWRLCLMALSINPLSHDFQDSYTLQALAWRTGQIHITPSELSNNLELAVYNGRLYVSFPPVPTIPLWLLTFIYDWATPNRIVILIYFLSGYAVAYSLCRRMNKADGPAAVWAAFLVAGCNLLYICWSGGVWYQAQALSFLLTLCAFRLLLNKTSSSWSMGLCCLALAVGCRPFQAVYVVPGLWMAYRNVQNRNKMPMASALARILLLCIPAILVGLGYGLYNMLRFGSFFEFGHTYLPEFQEYGPQFSLNYFSENLKNVFRLPFFEESRLDFPRFNGFAFYLVNPLFLLAAGAAVHGIYKKRFRTQDYLLVLCLVLHFNLLLLHRTFGGWQFGARYLIDLCPALFYLTLRHPNKSRLLIGTVMIWGVLFNLYGGLLFYLT